MHKQTVRGLSGPDASASATGALDAEDLAHPSAPGTSELQGLWADLDGHGEAEWRFRRLAELLDEVFYVFEPESNRILYVSPAFERVWGRSVDAVYRNPEAYIDAVVAEDLPVVLEALRRKRKGTPNRLEYRIRGPDGRGRWIWDRNFVVPGPPGKPLRIVGLAADVTEHRQARESMRQMERLEALGHLGGGLAHDFNNVLGVIMGNLERLATRAGLDAAAVGAVAESLEAVRRGRDIAASLLGFARRSPLQLTRFDLNRKLVQLLPLLRHCAGAAVRVDLQTIACPLPVEADAGSLDSALINLVANARDAMPGGGTVVLSTCVHRRTDGGGALPAQLAPGDYALVCVSDEGGGMRPEVLARALEPLFTTKPENVGTGLGLPMAYWMLRRHGGTLTLDSAEARGTRACLYVPLCREPSEGAAVPELARGAGAEPRTERCAAHEVGAAAVPCGPGPTVLVIEDDTALAGLVEMVLAEAGFQVTRACDSDRAQAALSESHFDILFTDLGIPGGLDGRMLAHWAATCQPGISVVLASGADLPGGSVPTDWTFLPKPYGPRELLDTLGAVVAGRPRSVDDLMGP